MPDQIGYFASLKNAAGKVFSYLASITLTGTDGKTLTVEDNSLVNQDLTTDADPTFDTLNLTSGQLIFPATQVPSAGANTLDDYEEGTFNVTFACGTSGTITIASNVDTMSYTKIGRVVIITGYITVASVNSPVGSLLINGLPFTSQAGTENSGWGAVSILANNLQATGITSMVGYIAPSSTSITIFHFADGVIGDAAADVKAGSDLIITATYFV